MLDIYQLAVKSPSLQHFTPIAVLKLQKMEEKKGLLTLCSGSGRTKLLQALQNQTRNRLREYENAHTHTEVGTLFFPLTTVLTVTFLTLQP